MTVCTADYFQHYIPIFIWSILNVWRDEVGIFIYLRGELDDITKRALDVIKVDDKNVKIVENYKTDYPYMVGTTNALRFTTEPIPIEKLLVTDVDFFFTKMPQDLFNWHEEMHKSMENGCYVGHHGPWVRPHRPEICNEWRGEFERIAGGFVLLYPDWWEKTQWIRHCYDKMLENGEWGHFRESDEVMLCRFVRIAKLPIAPKVPFPRFLRHLHLGDFKDSMKTRYEDRSKMRKLLDPRCVNQFLEALSDNTFGKIIEIVSKNKQVQTILINAVRYCNSTKSNG